MHCFFFTHFISLSICLYNIFYFSLVTLALVPVCLLSCVHLLSCFSLFPNWWLSLHAGCSSLLKMRFSVTVARCLVLGGSLRLGFYTLCVYIPLCIYLKKCYGFESFFFLFHTKFYGSIFMPVKIKIKICD